MGNPSRQDFNAATAQLGPQEAKSLDFLPLSATTLAVAVVDGEAEYSVEITLDDINDPAVTPFWFTHKDFPTGSTTTKYGESFTPWRWVRLNLVSLTGDVSFYVGQTLDASGSF